MRFPVNFGKFLRTPFFYRTPLMDTSCMTKRLTKPEKKVLRLKDYPNFG